MSSFQVSKYSISRIADVMTRKDGGCAKCLASDLDKMNFDAVTARYGEEEMDNRCSGFKYVAGTTEEEPWSEAFAAQVVKGFDCYLYQCSEGDVYKRELFKRVERVRDEMRALFDRKDPDWGSSFEDAYDKAQWE